MSAAKKIIEDAKDAAERLAVAVVNDTDQTQALNDLNVAKNKLKELLNDG